MYYVIAQDGQRYGPVDLATLNQWAVDNRVVPTTTLESSDGQRLEASAVPGIVFPTGAAAPSYGGTMTGPGVQGGFGAPGVGTSGYAPYQQGMTFGDNGQGDVTKAWIFGALGLLCCPIVFSTMGIVYGNNAAKKGHPQGKTAMYFSIATMVIGIGLNVILRFGMGGFGR